jgi:transcriptional regulator with XRE-family HTH domain
MGKKSNKQRIQQFQRDFGLLRKKHALNMLAERMGTDSGNLSNYSRGAKNPGEDFLDKFYTIFATEIQEMAEAYANSEQDLHLRSEDPPQEYARPDDRDDHIRTLKLNNEDLRNYLALVVKNNELLVLSNQKLAEAQLSLIARLEKSIRGAAGE